MPQDNAVADTPVTAEPAAPAEPSHETPPAADAQGAAPDQPADTKQPDPTPDPWESVKDHPDVKRRIEEEVRRQADALAQKRIAAAERRRLREEARAARTNEDADKALEIVGRIASEPDDDDDGPLPKDFLQKQQAAQPLIERLLRRPEYDAVYKREGEAAMNERYAKDPVAYAEWVDDQILELRIDAAAAKKAEALAKGIATEQVNKALQHVPVPLSGNGAAGGAAITIDRYNSDPELRAKLRSTPEGRRQIDDMMAREAARRG